MIQKNVSPLLIFFLIAFGQQLKAGWELTYRNTDPDGLISYDVMLVEDNMLKYSGSDISFIFDANHELLTFIINHNKSYWTGNIADFRKELDAAMKSAMDEMLQQLPEGQRKMYEDMLGDMNQMYATPSTEIINNTNISLVNTGESESVAGYDAVEYKVLVNEKLMETLWITKDLDMSSDLAPGKIQEMMNQLSPNIENDSFYEYTSDYLELCKSGFILKSQSADGENIEVIKLVERKISSDELAIPEDYTQITPAEYMYEQMMGTGSRDDDENW